MPTIHPLWKRMSYGRRIGALQPEIFTVDGSIVREQGVHCEG
jgi:hypothetical protein